MARQKVNGNADGIDDPIGDGTVPIVVLDGSYSDSEDDSGIPTVEPASVIVEADAPETGKRGRGRPRGSGNSARKSTTKEVQGDLTAILYSTHFMLAKLIKSDAIILDDEESEELAKALARVQKEFGVEVMSPKMAAIVNLCMVGGGIYGPRIVTVLNEKKKEKARNNATGTIQ